MVKEIKNLIVLANRLDEKGYSKEANYLDKVLKRAADVIQFPPKSNNDAEAPWDGPGDESDVTDINKFRDERDEASAYEKARNEELLAPFVFLSETNYKRIGAGNAGFPAIVYLDENELKILEEEGSIDLNNIDPEQVTRIYEDLMAPEE